MAKKVKVFVKNKQGVLDPQGKTVEQALHSLGYRNVSNMRIGKYMEFEIPSGLAEAKAKKEVKEMCEKLLANPVIEEYSYQINN